MGESLIIRSGGGVDTSNATATNNQLVEGYTCYVNDELVVGSILIKSPVNKTLYVSQSTNLESGYYVGNDVISTSSLSEETVASSEIVDILTDNNGWANGVFLNGTMVNKGAISQAFGANASYTIPQGWHNGSGKVTQALAVQGAVGITAGTGNQTVCSAGRWTTGDLWVWGNWNLVPWNIKNGINIFGVWGNYTGWVDEGGPWYNPLAELNVYSYHSSSEGDKFVYRYFVRNVYWKGWNYFNVRLTSNKTYGSRLNIAGTSFKTNQTNPGEYSFVQGDSNARFALPASFPNYIWASNSPYVSKQALSDSLKANLAQWYGSGNIPVVYTETMTGSIEKCDEKWFYFSLS